MKYRFLIWLLRLLFPLAAAFISSCSTSSLVKDTRNQMIISVRDQKLLLVRDGKPVKEYVVSTSKFGIGSANNSNATPLGRMEISRKIGDGQPRGMVFKSRRPTGEILKPNQPGRDPIVGRIMWLNGLEAHNRNTMSRFIYIHGTPEEWRLGTPSSYGCIRMSMKDVVDLYKRVGVGAGVRIIRAPMEATPEGVAYAQMKRRTSENLAASTQKF